MIIQTHLNADGNTVNNTGDIVDFNRANATDSFNFKTKITSHADGTIMEQ